MFSAPTAQETRLRGLSRRLSKERRGRYPRISHKLLLLTGYRIKEKGFLLGWDLGNPRWTGCAVYFAIWREDEDKNFYRVTKPTRLAENRVPNIPNPIQYVSDAAVLIEIGDVIGVYYGSRLHCLDYRFGTLEASSPNLYLDWSNEKQKVHPNKVNRALLKKTRTALDIFPIIRGKIMLFMNSNILTRIERVNH